MQKCPFRGKQDVSPVSRIRQIPVHLKVSVQSLTSTPDFLQPGETPSVQRGLER
jgi:hypothetical protein